MKPIADLPPRRVLIIEDYPDTVESCQILLQMAGHIVEVAYTGTIGLQAFRRFLPHVAFLSIALPEIDGYEIARIVRADPMLANIRLICVSGYSREMDRVRAFESGFDEVYTKPIDPNLMIDLVNRG